MTKALGTSIRLARGKFESTNQDSAGGKNSRVLSIMPNRPVRDQWEYSWKMERHFPIKPGQPIGMALTTVCFPSEFPN